VALPPGYKCFVCCNLGAPSTKARCGLCEDSYQRMAEDLKAKGLHLTPYYQMMWAADRVREIEQAECSKAVKEVESELDKLCHRVKDLETQRDRK